MKEETSTVDPPYKFSILPNKIEPHLEFIEISDDGYILLGASNLVARFWHGNIWYFKDSDFVLDKEHALSGYCCETSPACGQFLNNSRKVIVGEDSGSVSVFSISTFPNESIHFVLEMSIAQHEGWVTSLSLTPSKDRSITAGSDTAINIVDNSAMVTEVSYTNAHSRLITCLQSSSKEDIFASVSLDKSALLWDKRQSRPAVGLYVCKDSGLTSLSWRNETDLAVASQTGNLTLIDVRILKTLKHVHVATKPVHRILFNNDGLLAVCSDSNVVTVWDSDLTNSRYIDDQHNGMVRGLAWHPTNKKLYSCGFDRKVLSHEIEA